MYVERIKITQENVAELKADTSFADYVVEHFEIGADLWSCGMAPVLTWPDGRALLFADEPASPGRWMQDADGGILILCDDGIGYDEEGNEIEPENSTAH